MIEGEDQPLFERERFGHLAILHFVGGVVVADVVATISQDETELPLRDDAATDLDGHLVVLPNVLAVVVAHGYLHACAALRGRIWWREFGLWSIA